MTVYVTKDGYRVQLEPGQRVKFFPQGGGFQSSIPLETFLADFKVEDPNEPEFYPARASIDGRGDFPCWVSKNRWNGWAMPYFLPETVHLISIEFDSIGSEMHFDRDNKIWSFLCEGMTPEDAETWELEKITVDGVEIEVYGIGAGSWTWDAKRVESPS